MRDKERSTLSCDGTITGLADSHPGSQCWRYSAHKNEYWILLSCAYTYTCISIYVCMYVHQMYAHIYTDIHQLYIHIIYKYVCMYACIGIEDTQVQRISPYYIHIHIMSQIMDVYDENVAHFLMNIIE